MERFDPTIEERSDIKANRDFAKKGNLKNVRRTGRIAIFDGNPTMKQIFNLREAIRKQYGICPHIYAITSGSRAELLLNSLNTLGIPIEELHQIEVTSDVLQEMVKAMY